MTDFYAYVSYPTETGLTTDYPIPFPYIKESAVRATVGGVEVSYTLPSSNILRFNTAPTGFVELFRETDLAEAIVSFTDGTVEQASNFNISNLQLLFATQEAVDRAARMPFMQTGTVDFAGSRLIDIAEPVDATDVASKNYVDDTQSATIAAASAASSVSAAAALVSEVSAAGDAVTASAASTAILAMDALAAYTRLADATSNPLLDDEGGAITFGDWYYNTVSNAVWFYTGTEWATYYSSLTSLAAWTELLAPTNALSQPTIDLDLPEKYAEFMVVLKARSGSGSSREIHAQFSLDAGVTFETTGYHEHTAAGASFLPIGGNNQISTSATTLVLLEINRLGTGFVVKGSNGSETSTGSTGGFFDGGSLADAIRLTLHNSSTPYNFSTVSTVALYGR